MADQPEPGPKARRFLSLLRIAAANDSGDSLAPMTHCLPIKVPGADVPQTFTVYLIPDDRGTFLVSCRELPELLTHGEDERDAIARAKEAIRATLAARPSSPDILD